MAAVARPVVALVDAALRPFAHVVFSTDRVSGACVLLAIGTFPRLAAATLVAVAVAHVATLALGFGRRMVRDGTLACGAVLTTLAIATTAGLPTLPLAAAGAVLAVIVGAAARSFFARATLPTHSLPFILCAWMMALAIRALPRVAEDAAPAHPWTWLPAQAFDESWLDVPAAMLFLTGGVAGLLVVAAILWHSRIAALLAVLGLAAAEAVRWTLRAPADWSTLDLIAAFNAVLAAMALGGVWFVPHPTSILLGALGAMVACLITYALTPVAGAFALPVLSLPFVLTTIAVLAAMRMREHDRNPASALPAPRPEEALARHLMRVRRFGDFAWLPFRLPFRGSWVVTQGVDGPHTHKGPWRHAFDFEVLTPDGQRFRDGGASIEDYPCYGLPVLAAGTGTVDHVVDGVPDNPVGGLNARDNWGNVVVIAHGSNLYSVSAHLQPRSIRVKPGDLVRSGAEIGRCGNSGRSLVPHLHFQVQRGPVLGSETVPADFGDVVARTDGALVVAHRVIPTEGAVVRPVLRDESIAQALEFAPGSTWRLAETGGSGRTEDARIEIDLWGRRVLRSDSAQLFLETYDAGLVLVAFDGQQDSLLRLLLLSLARVPFDQESGLTWRDRIPRRLIVAGGGTLVDLMAVAAPRWADLEVTYSSRRTERSVVIEGRAATFTTRVSLDLNGGAHDILVAQRHATTTLTMRAAAAVRQE